MARVATYGHHLLQVRVMTQSRSTWQNELMLGEVWSPFMRSGMCPVASFPCRYRVRLVTIWSIRPAEENFELRANSKPKALGHELQF